MICSCDSFVATMSVPFFWKMRSEGYHDVNVLQDMVKGEYQTRVESKRKVLISSRDAILLLKNISWLQNTTSS